MKSSLNRVLLSGAMTSLLLSGAQAQSINAGDRAAQSNLPFDVQEIASFDTPWAIAVLPDDRMLITEKGGAIFLVTPDGRRTPVANVPEVAASGQNGLLDIAISSRFESDQRVYLSYVEPGSGGSGLALAMATLSTSDEAAALDELQVIWRQMPQGSRGQPGGIIAFDPDGAHLFLTVGDRMIPEGAQDPDRPLGKVLRLELDGSIPADNPNAGEDGIRAQTWTTGHRNPYGLAFAPDGALWLHEMGPRGGDELNLIVAGQNYGWPEVSNGNHYSGQPIPDHDTRPEFAAPAVYWNPTIAPAGLSFYTGAMFPEWDGSAFIGGLASTALIRVTFGPDGTADEADRWDMGARIRDVAVANDGAVLVIQDSNPGRLLRLVSAD